MSPTSLWTTYVGAGIRSEVSSAAVDYDLLDEIPDGYVSDPENAFMCCELGCHIASALQRLTPREHIVFELRH